MEEFLRVIFNYTSRIFTNDVVSGIKYIAFKLSCI